MDWLPPIADFRTQLRAATETADARERLEKLAFLAQHRLRFLELLQLDRELGAIGAPAATGFSSLRLAILGSSTVDHLVPAIRVAGLRRRIMINAYAGGYNQYRAELLDPHGALHRFAPQFVLLSLTAREAIAGVPLDATAPEVDAAVDRAISELRMLWRRIRDALNAAPVQQTYLDVGEPLFGSYDRIVPGAPTRVIARLNDRLCDAAAGDGVLLLDVAAAAARDGTGAWFDPARWFQAKMEIAPPAAAGYGELVARLLAAQRGLSKKCLVLDLDNTLWGGVVGDDGLEGIVLGEGSAAGEAHRAFQRYAKQLGERGVILAVCSKNDPAIAESVFRDHPEMILKRSDFAAFVANWTDKAENLKTIAAQLNIGVDSLVFVDDNAAERSRIRTSLPIVAVPELPDDPAGYVRCLADAGYFEAVAFTRDDRDRAAQYAANVERQSLFESSQDMGDFLKGLQMSVTFGPFDPVDLTRVTQLINKTNQFNPTTRRYTERDVAVFAAAPENLTLQFRLLDKFGDNGLVSAMIFRPDPTQPDLLEIDTWVMSCRVFGRELEFEAMNIAVEAARRRGVYRFRADYVPTARNSVVSTLYGSLGFRPCGETAAGTGASRWNIDLADYAPRRTYIKRMPKQP
jgi:FkbH-like protein